MKIVDAMRRNGKEYSIAVGIKGTLTFNGYDSGGKIEQLEESVNRIANMLGNLTEKLHSKGVLDDADIADFIGFPFSVQP